MAHWQRIIPFFAFPSEIRRAIYTTNKGSISQHPAPSSNSSIPALIIAHTRFRTMGKKWQSQRIDG